MSDQPMDDAEILDYTQTLRQRMVDALCKGGEITTDPKELTILEKTLGSMDKQVFSKARQKSLDREVDNNEKAQQYIAELFESMDLDRGRFVSEEAVGEIPEPDLEDGQIDEGSLEVGISDEKFEDFSKRMGD